MLNTFEKRISHGNEAEKKLRLLLEKFGFSVVPYGQEYRLPKEMHALLRFKHDETSLRARFVPDFLAVSKKYGAYYFEAKSSSSDKYKNFCMEKAAYQVYSSMAGGNVIIAFYSETKNKFYANFVNSLRITMDMSENRKSARGSQTPFLLIDKQSCIDIESLIASLAPSVL